MKLLKLLGIHPKDGPKSKRHGYLPLIHSWIKTNTPA